MGEYFFYVIAAMGARIGTGLAGLSAATVMVPILIVLCPSFGGKYGAYQATAIALASDILGSAVTSATYARNKNIDLRHGWIMLVVFMAFLGYELKTAVGTSTFIMTFTALIAFISHVCIHPAIVMERWNVLILCIIVATISSLISAQFANRVSSHTVGLVTGVVLTVLGASMIYLNYFAGI